MAQSSSDVPASVPHRGAASAEGFRIGVTSDRRADDMIAAFERRGAQVLHAPALRVVPLADDPAVVADTRRIIDAGPDISLITTAYGMRRWVETADVAGIGESLIMALGGSRIMVRGPKARGAVRAAGLNDDFIAGTERVSELVDHVIGQAQGLKIAVQLHGWPDTEQLDRLRKAGAEVLTVAPYRWAGPGTSDRLPQLVDAVCGHRLDAVTFTSAPAVDAVFSAAGGAHRLGELIDALRTGVVAAAVGDVTAAPLRAEGIAPIVPERFRLGALIRLVCEHLADHGVVRADTARGVLEIRGDRVAIGGASAVDTRLSPAPLAILTALARQPGAAVAREALMSLLPGDSTERGLDMAVSRLRRQLPYPELIVTVVKRGYRLRTAP